MTPRALLDWSHGFKSQHQIRIRQARKGSIPEVCLCDQDHKIQRYHQDGIDNLYQSSSEKHILSSRQPLFLHVFPTREAHRRRDPAQRPVPRNDFRPTAARHKLHPLAPRNIGIRDIIQKRFLELRFLRDAQRRERSMDKMVRQ